MHDVPHNYLPYNNAKLYIHAVLRTLTFYLFCYTKGTQHKTCQDLNYYIHCIAFTSYKRTRLQHTFWHDVAYT